MTEHAPLEKKKKVLIMTLLQVVEHGVTTLQLISGIFQQTIV